MIFVIQLSNMINFNTVTLKELYKELLFSKQELLKKIRNINYNYNKELRENCSPEENILIDGEIYTSGGDKTYELSLLKRYYKSYSFESLINDANDTIKIIDKLISEPIILKNTINQLKRITEKKRLNSLGQIEDDIIDITKEKNPTSIYKNSYDLDKFLKNFLKITINLEDFIGENNPLIKKVDKEDNTKNSSFWVTKNNKGNYLYDGSLVDIKNEKAQYMVIFDVIYSLKPKGGLIAYKDIINECRKRKLKITQKSILRALTGEGTNANFFRYIKDIKQSPSRGINLFRTKQDRKYIEFNNKK